MNSLRRRIAGESGRGRKRAAGLATSETDTCSSSIFEVCTQRGIVERVRSSLAARWRGNIDGWNLGHIERATGLTLTLEAPLSSAA